MTSFDKNIDFIHKNFVEIKPSAEIALDLKYATADNFMKQNMYGDFKRCFVSPVAHLMLLRACVELKLFHPQLQFLIWDALRPRSIQSQFYDRLKGTAFENYVAPPEPGSLHNFGMAIDLTLQNKNGEPLDMGTGFDDFSDLSQPKLENQFLNSGQLTQTQLDNRLLLRRILGNHGFQVLDHEWWHFNALPKEQVYQIFPILE